MPVNCTTVEMFLVVCHVAAAAGAGAGACHLPLDDTTTVLHATTPPLLVDYYPTPYRNDKHTTYIILFVGLRLSLLFYSELY